MSDFFLDTQRLAALPPIDGKYRILAALGRGGMGAVFAVENIHSGQKFAMKVLHASLTEEHEAVERFRREVNAMLAIQSPNVVQVYEGGVARDLGGAPYFVMERLVGTDLSTLLRTKGKQPTGKVLDWFDQIARGVGFAHERGLVHRDLKPANLFVTMVPGGGEILKVLDFGVAKLMGETATLTATNAAVGTPRYMAPEQARASRNVTPAADQWSLGLIVYDLLTGRQYFEGSKTADILASVLFNPIVPPSNKGAQLGRAFDEWFLRSCCREPKQRWASVREQADGLRAALTGASSIGSRAAPVSTTSRAAAPVEDPGPLSDDTVRTVAPSFKGEVAALPRPNEPGVAIEGAPQKLLDKTQIGVRRSGAPVSVAKKDRRPTLLLLAALVFGLVVSAGTVFVVVRFVLAKMGK